MELLQHYTKLQTFIPAFTAEPDAVFALNNMTALLERTDWKQVRKDILTTDADWLELKDKLVFSDDFVEQNRETVTEFYCGVTRLWYALSMGNWTGRSWLLKRCDGSYRLN